jgi:hypothetical protein
MSAPNHINVEKLKDTFTSAGFPVKRAEKVKNLFWFEFNHPDEKSAVAMRVAMLKNGAEVSTFYQYVNSGEALGELASRERAVIPFANDEELRQFFNKVIDDYSAIADEKSHKPESSYKRETRTRRALM